MEKIADKKNGITTEDAAAFLTGVEIFFISLIGEFFIMWVFPFKISNVMMFGTIAVIWYYTHYVMRNSLKKKIIEAGIREDYKELEKSNQKHYLLLSIVIFFLVFFVFFAASVWMIGGYDKRWQ